MDLAVVSKDKKDLRIPIGDYNEKVVRRVIEQKENPHPTLVFSISIVLMVIMYYIYVCYVKTQFAGRWYSDTDEEYTIEHNQWNDNITIKQTMTTGYVNGGAIICGDKNIGAMCGNNIHWTNGSIWKRGIATKLN